MFHSTQPKTGSPDNAGNNGHNKKHNNTHISHLHKAPTNASPRTGNAQKSSSKRKMPPTRFMLDKDRRKALKMSHHMDNLAGKHLDGARNFYKTYTKLPKESVDQKPSVQNEDFWKNLK